MSHDDEDNDTKLPLLPEVDSPSEANPIPEALRNTDPRLVDLQMRQAFMDRGAREYAHQLYQATGQAPQAVIVIVHWPNDIMFSASMGNATPQAQMNAVDAMLKHLATVGQKLKAAINAVRHGMKPGDTRQ